MEGEEGTSMQYRGLTLVEHDGSYYFEDRELAAKHDRKSEDSEKREAFLQKYGLRVSSATPSLNHLTKGRVGLQRAGMAGGFTYRTISDERSTHPAAIGWFDHTKLLYHPSPRRYVITTQPYGLTLEKFQALEAFCAERDLACWISITEAWWYPGSTPLVVLAHRDTIASLFTHDKE